MQDKNRRAGSWVALTENVKSKKQLFLLGEMQQQEYKKKDDKNHDTIRKPLYRD